MDRSDESDQEKVEKHPTGSSWSILWRLREVLRFGLAGLGRRRSPRRMELIETLALGGKRQLMFVVCDGRSFLVGAGGEGVQAIAEMGVLCGSTSSTDTEFAHIVNPTAISADARCSA